MARLDVVCWSVRIVSRAESGGLVEEDPDYEPGLHLLSVCVCAPIVPGDACLRFAAHQNFQNHQVSFEVVWWTTAAGQVCAYMVQLDYCGCVNALFEHIAEETEIKSMNKEWKCTIQ